MGVSSSRIEEDKALQLCRVRKKLVRQALDGRCSLAAAHVAYIQSLKSTGYALRKFVEPEGPVESSLYTSTTATPEPLALTEKALSQFSFSSQSVSQRVDATETFSPTPSPPSSRRIHTNHMKFSNSFSKKVEEKPPIPVVQTVTTSSTPQNTTPRSTEGPEGSPFEGSSLPSGTPPWDFFGLFHPIDHQFSFQEGKGIRHGFENSDDINRLREEEGIPELEDDEEKVSLHGKEESQDSEDEFDEPDTDSLVRSFENLNRVHDHDEVNASITMPSAGSTDSETKLLNGGKTNSPFTPSAETVASDSGVLNGEKRMSPDLSPLRARESVVAVPAETNKSQVKEGCIENKVAPKDFSSSMKDIEFLFTKASESGREVPRMLEANKLHFRPIFPGKQSGSTASMFLKACFSCGDDPSQVQEGQEEPIQTDVKYLTWHRTVSSRSSSSRNPLGANSKDDIDDLTDNVFESICMISGSHASTLDRLYAWERKLYDEVKASGIVRRDYDIKCKALRQLESNGVSSHRIDKTRADVKDLHSRIRVAIHRIDSISTRIEELRDKELQPQLEELIDGLSRMWEVMSECHKLQFHIISIAFNNGNAKISMQSESRRQVTVCLENELSTLSSSFSKWIGAQKSYFESLNCWLHKCVNNEEKSSRRKRGKPPPRLRNVGPPINVTCDVWLEKVGTLPYKDVADTIKDLAAETARFLPRQEKKDGNSAALPNLTSWKTDNNSDSAVNGLRDEASEDFISGFDHFRSSLVAFFGQLNKFADGSVNSYTELDKAIQESKHGVKQKNIAAEGRNRQVLKDIGNLVKGRAPEGKLHDQKPQAEKKYKKPIIEENAATAKLDPKKGDEKSKPISGRQLKEGVSRKNLRTFTSTLSARSKAVCGLTNKPKDQIANIDAKDADNELAVVEYIDKLYSFYKISEDETKVDDYMGLQPDINAKMRSILVDWLIVVHHKFELMPETLYLTINIVDRYLSMKVVPRRELQLVGISSMLLACKYEEIWAPEVNDFVCISDNAYMKEQILVMEKAILGKLGWYLTVPTPYVFLVRYIKASVPNDEELENMVFFLAELGIMHYSASISYSPSTIAASAVYGARCTLERNPVWNETLEHHTGYSEDQLMDCAKLLVSFHSGAAESKLKAVFKKYSSTKSGAVALHSPAKELLVESS